ncbi:hypothetical protein GCM10010505_54710 [Kitasatospora aburaviensis]
MEFLVDMVTTVPDGTSDEAVAEIRAREAARARELAAGGSLLRLWRPPLEPGQWRTWGLFRAADEERLEEVLASMPLRVWRRDTVTPLSPHPNDPGAAAATGGDPATAGDRARDEEELRAVIDRWKAAVDAHEPERVAACFTQDALFQGLHPYSVGRQGVADYYRAQPLGMAAAYRVLEVRRPGPDLLSGYLGVDFSFVDRPTLAVHLGVQLRRTGDGWLIDHYQVSALP